LVLRAALIATAAAIIYLPVLHGDWLWDDDIDITGNAITQSPTGWWTIWTEPGAEPDYYPIKATVQWAQWQLWGADTFGYHLTNLLLHILGAWLVWRLLSKFNLKFAWIGGLLFAVHPVNVESVAWIAELKNTLSLPPFLLAMCAWIDYEAQERKRDYALALGFFLVAMLCKTTLVMFPVVILLYAWWKRSRLGWCDLKISAPFFAISLALGLLTLFLQKGHISHVPSQQFGGFFFRWALGGEALAVYFFRCLWPMGLTLMAPKWAVDPLSTLAWLPWLGLGGLLAWFWTRRAGWGRHLLLGFGFFVINLAPFLGFISTGYMRFTWVMDHFLYLPIIGLIGLAAAGWDWLEARLALTARWSIRAAGAGAIILLTAESWSYAQTFTDQETLWTYTIRENPEAWLALNNLGEIYRRANRIPEAKDEFAKALRINPDSIEARNNMGVVLWATGQAAPAMEQFQAALKLDPTYAQAHYNMGVSLGNMGHLPEAMQEYNEALHYDPQYAPAHDNLGAALLQQGRIAEAQKELEAAMKIDPNAAHSHYNMGNLFLTIGKADEALAQYEKALQLDPTSSEAHANRGVALVRLGRTPEAIEEMETAVRLDPHNDSARSNLAQIQAAQKK
jgi:tetratricopeptide (TPR) repeat protein